MKFDFGINLGIDLGTSTVLIYNKNRGVVLNDMSIVAINKDDDQILSVGEAAYGLLGRTTGNVVAIKPLKDGVISDYEITKKMLKTFVDRVIGPGSIRRVLFRPSVVICVPCGITEVEKRAVVLAAEYCGAKKTYILEEPVAAALGAGLDISKPCGSMIVDIGGGTTDVAVISMGGIVESSSVKIAGDKFDEAIVRFLRRRFNILIGDRTAENIKVRLGTLSSPSKEDSMDVRGRNTATGLPMSVRVTAEELYEPLNEVADIITDTVCVVLEKIPPELSADISERGIILTGGAARLRGLDKYLQNRTGIRVIVADEPELCVAKGTGVAMDNLAELGKRAE
ncbi:MAG: rod shape-determining protein [Clostridia bacterium]|nr:rod shape-determining protein [Clostridia bacterium]